MNRASIALGIVAFCGMFCGTTPLALAQNPSRQNLCTGVCPTGGSDTTAWGLVVGLKGTGDDLATCEPAMELLKAALKANKADDLDPSQFQRKVAVVLVTVYGRGAGPDGSADVEVRALCDANSLAGGSLLMTPLQTIDFHRHGIAQGTLTACPKMAPNFSRYGDAAVACVAGGAVFSR